MSGRRCKALRRAFIAANGRAPNKARVVGRTPIALGFLAGLRAFFRRKRDEAGENESLREKAKRAAEAVFYRIDFAPSEWRRLKKAERRAASRSETFFHERALLAAHRDEVRRMQKREAREKRRAAA